MIESVVFTADYRCFRSRQEVRLLPGLNVLVGANGSGKSTLLKAIRAEVEGHGFAGRPVWVVRRAGNETIVAWDSEADNLRQRTWIENDTINEHVNALWQSHGEANLHALHRVLRPVRERSTPGVLVLDEADTGLSIRNAICFAHVLLHAVDLGWQVIVSSHHPYVIMATPEVLDMDRGGQLTPAQEYVDRSQREAMASWGRPPAGASREGAAS